MVNALLSSGVEGLSRSQAGLTDSAKTIARGGQSLSEDITPTQTAPQDEMLAAAVDMAVYEVQFKASAKVVATADEMVGTLLDEFV